MATYADAEALKSISRRTIVASYGPFLGQATIGDFIASGQSERYIDENLASAAVILVDDRVAGFCVCKENTIDNLMIDRDCQRRGLGTRLLRHCEDALLASHDELRLKSFAGNDAANAFYVANGWRAGETFVDPEFGIPMVTFTKRATGGG